MQGNKFLSSRLNVMLIQVVESAVDEGLCSVRVVRLVVRDVNEGLCMQLAMA